MLGIELSGKRAFVAGIADDGGFGFAIAKALAEAGASVCVGTWPPAYKIFTTMLERGKFDDSLKLSDGSNLSFEKIYPFDADYDSAGDIPEDVKNSRRYRDYDDVSIQGVAGQFKEDFGEQALDIFVHSLANGPEVKNPLLETSRQGYLAAVGASSYSFTASVAAFAPLMPKGSTFLALSYMASQRVVPGYGGGMSSAKAALESDTRLLAYEAGRKWGHRVNAISAGAFASRAASAIGMVQDMIEYSEKNAPLPQVLTADEVANTAAFLCSPLASGITGEILYVDKGLNTMGLALEESQ